MTLSALYEKVFLQEHTHTPPTNFSQFKSYRADRFMYVVLNILFALYDREAAWEHFWKLQLFSTALAWVLSKGHSPSGMGCSSVGPPMEPQVLPGACCSMGSL